jgi:biotin carboxyl carrier protein
MTDKTMIDDIAVLIKLYTANGWSELRVATDQFSLLLSNDPDASLAGAGREAPQRTRPAQAAPVASTQPAMPEAADIPAGWVAVTAPNLGTFYRSPKPGAAAFVELDQTVEANTEVCLLEVMKRFTSVKAGAAGVIRRICVADAVLVEGGQVLFHIEPA